MEEIFLLLAHSEKVQHLHLQYQNKNIIIQLLKKAKLSRINIIEQNIAEIENWCPKEKEQYISDKKVQAAIERNIQIVIQAILDICIQFIKLFNLDPPKSDENVIISLRNYLKHTEKILKLKKFHNFLVHIYGNINSGIVFEKALQMIKDIPDIVSDFKNLLEKIIKKMPILF